MLLAAGLNGVFLTGDLFNFYVFFELSMTPLRPRDIRRRRLELGAALVFTTVNLLGTFFFLLSIASLYRVTGTLDMARIGERMAVSDRTRRPDRGRVLRGFSVKQQDRPTKKATT